MRIEFHLVAGLLTALTLPASFADAGTPPQIPRIGDTHEITLTRRSVQQGSNGSSGSSTNKETIIEQVIGLREDGLEVQYDLPKAATANDRARAWQFPVRVFKPFAGPMQLLNSRDLEARRDDWLKAAGLSREACGRWIFTWNAFRIECDPQSIIKTVQAYDLGSTKLREGDIYRDAEAANPGKLVPGPGRLGGNTVAAEMMVDPDAVRHARAESDVVVGEIMQKPVTLEAALRERAGEVIAGTITIAIEADAAGYARRRTKVTKLDIKSLDGLSETQAVTEILERRRISPRR